MIKLNKKEKAVLDAALCEMLRGDKSVNINCHMDSPKGKEEYIRGYDLAKVVQKLINKFNLF